MGIDQISGARAGLWPKIGMQREKPVAGDTAGFTAPASLPEGTGVKAVTRNELGGIQVSMPNGFAVGVFRLPGGDPANAPTSDEQLIAAAEQLVHRFRLYAGPAYDRGAAAVAPQRTSGIDTMA
ncbi:hypothetical protein GAY28_08955 [Azospirillum brasilense]|nr:hypothetical protein [Azospirillum brasilense]